MSFGNARTIKWTAPLLIVSASLSSVGCKSGWKMPGANMFGWNKTPSAETLASDLSAPKIPESPANKYTPTAVASNATGTKPSNTAATATPYGSGAMGLGGTSLSAANANGYQTGPYSTTSSAYPTASAGGATSMIGSTAGRTSTATAGTYGGTAGLGGYAQPASTYGPSSTTGNSLAGARLSTNTTMPQTQPIPTYGSQSSVPAMPAGLSNMTAGSGTSPGLSSGANPTMNSGAVGNPGYTMPNLAGTSSATIPNMLPPSTTVGGTGSPTTVPVGYPTATAGSFPMQQPAAQGQWQSASPMAQTPSQSVATASLPPSQPSLPAIPAIPGSTVQSTFTMPSGSTGVAGGYRPGTTGRATSYNFATPGTLPTATVPVSANTSSLPAIPSTPSSAGSYPAYGGPSSGIPAQLPPNTASGTGPGMTSPIPTGTMYR